MNPRKNLIAQFSSFALLDDDRFQKWLPDPQLQRSMTQQLHQSMGAASGKMAPQASEETENDWALYWHQAWRQQASQRSQLHLLAYLQEACFWVAKNLGSRFAGPSQQSTLTLSDYFQMALAEVEPLLHQFDVRKSSQLQPYARVVLACRVKGILRQQKAADFCSAWGLLRKTSKKRVLASLQAAGLTPTEVDRIRILWDCFQSLYVQNRPGGVEKLPQPDRALWEAIAQRYNEQVGRLGTLAEGAETKLPRSEPAFAPLTASQAEDQLSKLAARLRAYLNPPVQSLNQLKYGPDGVELQAELADLEGASLLDQMIDTEEQQQRSQLHQKLQQVLLQSLEAMDPSACHMLRLHYSQGLTQQEIMSHLQVSQPTVCRRLKATKHKLLTALVQWLAKDLNKFPDPEQLMVMTQLLEEWLQVSFPESPLGMPSSAKQTACKPSL
jgi:RNA polymerase sigma factor (sigma-70 family)